MRAFSIQRQAVNSLWLVLARVFAQTLALVFTALVARSFGEAGFGQFAFVAAVIFVGNIATTFGTDTLIIRELAGVRANEFAATTSRNPPSRISLVQSAKADLVQLLPRIHSLVSTALWLQLFLSAIFIAAAFLFASPLIALYSFSLMPLAFYTVYSSSLRAFERMDLYLQVNVASSLLQLLSGVIVFITQSSLTTLITLLLVSQITTAFIAAIVCRKNLALDFPWGVSTESLLPIIRAAFPFAVLTTLAFIYQRLGIFTLSFSLGDQATGGYAAAARLVDATKIFPQAWLGALLPALARLRNDTGSSMHASRESHNWMMLFGAASAAILIVFAPILITLIYGNRFDSAIQPLQVLALSLLPYAFTAHITLVLVARGAEWMVLRGTLLAVLFAVVLFAVLVPQLGLAGASWASVIAEWMQAVIFWRLNRNDSHKTG